MIYFDNAATTFPKPSCVVNAVQDALVHYGANPGRSGHDLSLQTAEMVYACRERAAQLFNCQPEQVVFTKNCTEATNTAIKGLVRKGDHVIISDLEHNAVYRVVEALKRLGIIEYDIAPVFDSDEQTVWYFERLLRPNTRLIACTHGSNVFGIKTPVEKIGAMAHRRGVLMLVDAAQTAGLVDIDLSLDAIDYLCMPGHKGLYGPAGTGILIVNNDILLEPLCEGGTGSLSMEAAMPEFLPDRLESGTVNTSGIIGLKKGIEFVIKNTPQRLYQNEMNLCRYIYGKLSRIDDVKLYTCEPRLGKHLPLISFNIAGISSEQAARMLNDRHIAVRAGFHCAALAHKKMRTDTIGGTIRLSLGAFNTREEADAFCRAVEQIAFSCQREKKKF